MTKIFNAIGRLWKGYRSLSLCGNQRLPEHVSGSRDDCADCTEHKIEMSAW